VNRASQPNCALAHTSSRDTLRDKSASFPDGAGSMEICAPAGQVKTMVSHAAAAQQGLISAVLPDVYSLFVFAEYHFYCNTTTYCKLFC
jgi:hypothetical protein